MYESTKKTETKSIMRLEISLFNKVNVWCIKNKSLTVKSILLKKIKIVAIYCKWIKKSNWRLLNDELARYW